MCCLPSAVDAAGCLQVRRVIWQLFAATPAACAEAAQPVGELLPLSLPLPMALLLQLLTWT